MPKYDLNLVEYVKAIPKDASVRTGRRFSLEIKLKNRQDGKRACVIMLNPSAAEGMHEQEKNNAESDRSVNRVISYIDYKVKDVSDIVILNLFTKYETYPSELEKKLNSKSYEYISGIEKECIINNDKIIKEEIDKCDYVIVAWGDLTNYFFRKRECEILLMLEAVKNRYIKVKCIGKLSNWQFPRHPSRIEFERQLLPYFKELNQIS